MFESAWEEESDQPYLSALSRALVQSQPKKVQRDRETLIKVKSKSETKVKRPKSEKILKKVAQKLDNGIDKYVNSPSATRKLLSDDDDSPLKENREKKKLVKRLKSTAAVVNEKRKKLGKSLSASSLKESGHLLKLGSKFSCQDAFLRFVGLPGKDRKGDQAEASEENFDPESLVDSDVDEKEVQEEASISPPRKKRKDGGLDVNKLKDIFAKEDQKNIFASNRKVAMNKNLAEQAR